MSKIHYEARVVCQLIDQRDTFDCWHSDLFSRACSAIWRAGRGLQEGFEDMRAFGAPSECGKAIVQSSEREAIEGIEKAGFSVEQFVFECMERLDNRTIYYMQLFDLLPINRVLDGEHLWLIHQRQIADSGC